MIRRLILAAIMTAVLLSPAPRAGYSAEKGESPALAVFDDEVAVFRRVVRQYCAVVQEMAAKREADSNMKEKGLELLVDAREQWAAIVKSYSGNPPAEYASDAQFAARLGDISNALEDMYDALVAGQARRSMLACGYACGLFVNMHEENGLVYALDRLFHLRKTGKTAAAVFKARGLEGVRPLLPNLLRYRDDVLLAPQPWPAGDARNAEYSAAMNELSEKLDRLASAVVSGNSGEAGSILAGFMLTVNKPYGLAL